LNSVPCLTSPKKLGNLNHSVSVTIDPKKKVGYYLEKNIRKSKKKAPHTEVLPIVIVPGRYDLDKFVLSGKVLQTLYI
jgi:hypothetical protein